MTLPVETVLPSLSSALAAGRPAVLQAPPGAGKTTLVPPALLDAPWLGGQRIVMLEPRRLAARAAAHRMADLRGEAIAETVGYRIRLDTRVGPRTRIEVVTEGVLTRMLQDDRSLAGIGVVIFDEFHERSLHADLGLALTLETRAVLRPDLRIIVMSATLDGRRVAALLGDAVVISSEGRLHSVELRYLGGPGERRIEGHAAGAVRRALAETAGDVLVFLPGASEIRKVHELLLADGLDHAVHITPLYGALSFAEQDAAIRPSPPGRRKVVLATSIAQTSLTIEGVGSVVDSGLSRVPRFSPRSGMTSLETVRVSRASADQRAGRAGRLGPGVCYRLWGAAEQATLLPHDPPEILEADLTPLALELAVAGIADPAELAWLDPPPAAALSRARDLLRELEALDDAHGITPRGRSMAAVPAHPRLAHMLLEARRIGLGPLACDIAALLGERDVLRGAGRSADLRLRLDALGGRGGDADRDAVRRVRAGSADLRRQIGLSRSAATSAEGATDVECAGQVLAFAYPDRIGQRRPGSAPRYLLRNGTGAYLGEGDPLADSPWIVAAETDGARPESRVYLAAPVALDELLAELADQVERNESVTWDEDAGAVLARRRERLGALVLSDAPIRDADPELVSAALLAGLARAGVEALPWTDAARGLRQRLGFLRARDPAWPDASDASLSATLATWLGPHLAGMRRRDDVARVDLYEALMGLLAPRQRRELERLAPTHVTVPSGSRIPIDYRDPAAPVLAVRLQEMFGLGDTPKIAGGAVPLTLHLLSPAQRPVQVTRDLAGFWRTTYFEVRKDLKGRYPRHYWPDDPMQAEPTRRARPRGR